MQDVRRRRSGHRPLRIRYRTNDAAPGHFKFPPLSFEEMRRRPREQFAFDEDVHLLVVKGNEAGDWRKLAGGEVIGLREIGVSRFSYAD
jgi:hypothetical protein